MGESIINKETNISFTKLMLNTIKHYSILTNRLDKNIRSTQMS